MATTVRASSSAGGTSTAPSVGAPAGTATGDLALLIIHSNGAVTIVDNNGSTAFTEDVNDFQNGANQTISLFSRRIQGGDPSTYAATLGSSQNWTAVAIALQNPNTSTIYDVVSSNNSGVSASPTANSINTTSANALHFVVVGMDGGATTITGTPAGYTVEKNTTGGRNVAVCYKVIASASATGIQTFTASGSDNFVTLSFAIADIGGGAAAVTYPQLERYTRGVMRGAV